MQNMALASSGDDGSVCLSTDGGTRDLMVAEREHGSNAVSLSLAFSARSRFLGAGGDDGVVRVWDLSTSGRPRRVHAHTSAVTCVCWSAAAADERTAADASSEGSQPLLLTAGSELGEITTHALAEGRPPTCVSRLVLSAGQRPVACSAVQFSPLRTAMLASADSSGAVRLWDLAAAREGGGEAPLAAHEFSEHAQPCTGLAWSSVNHLLLASVGRDGKLCFYDTHQCTAVKQVLLHTPLTAVAFLADGVTIAAGTDAGSIHVFDLRMSLAPMRSALASDSSCAVHDLAFQHVPPPHQRAAPGPHEASARERAREEASESTASRRAAAESAAADLAERARRTRAAAVARLAPREAESGHASSGHGHGAAAAPRARDLGGLQSPGGSADGTGVSRGDARARHGLGPAAEEGSAEERGGVGARRTSARASACGDEQRASELASRRPFRQLDDNDGVGVGAPSADRKQTLPSAAARADEADEQPGSRDGGAKQRQPYQAGQGQRAAHELASLPDARAAARPGARAGTAGAPPTTPSGARGAAAAPPAEPASQLEPAAGAAAAGPAHEYGAQRRGAQARALEQTPWLVATTTRKAQRDLLSPQASLGGEEEGSERALRHMPIFAEAGDTPAITHSVRGSTGAPTHRRAGEAAGEGVRASAAAALACESRALFSSVRWFVSV